MKLKPTNHCVENVLTIIITIKKFIYDTNLAINVQELIENYRIFKHLVPPNTKMMVMVKAFSYGLGKTRIAKILEKENVDYLSVANILEGIKIRKSGVNTPILIMNPEVANFDLVIKYKLTPSIFSFHHLHLFIQYLKKENVKHPYKIHIKLDTGMHRLGFNAEQIETLIKKLKTNQDQIKIEGIFSHLAASDDSDCDNFTNHQVTLFNDVASKITEQFDYKIDKHILNSNGIIRFPEYTYDMVRLGIGLYGICNDEQMQAKLKQVSTLYTKISHIIEVKKGESIGYNRKGIAKKDTRIATIPIGYADGFNRLLSNGKWKVIVNGEKAPTIGNVTMDMTMIDIGELDCKPGDEVIVFGKENTISLMASQINTIPYEILTSISPRVNRFFY